MNASSHPKTHLLQAESHFLSRLEPLFAEALETKTFSGASLLIGDPYSVILEHCWGATKTEGRPIDLHTAFDLASLTKALITAPLAAWLISCDEISLNDTLERFFPSATLSGKKREITIKHLLNHCSGLPPYVPFYLELITLPFHQRRDRLLSHILDTPLLSPPGTICRYSDLGFILLGRIVEEVKGKPLDRLSTEILLHHANEELFFRPFQSASDPTVQPKEFERSTSVFAATEFCHWRDRLLEGEVHDENAFCLGGVAGHAGLFGTARGVYRILSFLWRAYIAGEPLEPLWSPRIMRSFWSVQSLDPESTWALGFDTPSPSHSSAGRHFSPGSVGHLGFTGTSFWIDLEKELAVVLLTNRVYPSRENQKIKTFRPQVHNLIMEAYHDIPQH